MLFSTLKYHILKIFLATNHLHIFACNNYSSANFPYSCFEKNVHTLLQFKNDHSPQSLTTAELKYIAGLSNTTHLNLALDNMCIPRVVGTKGHDRVHDYIVGEMKNLGWHVEVDTFQEKTPNFGTLTFRNIIATLNPNAERYLLLACHYDSKYFKDFEFEGATDSAVPCAMLINLATVMKKELAPLREDVDLKFFFFDGEEAFENWSPTDSIYGARHLAKVYENKLRLESGPSHLERIDMLVLLDLIGAANPHFFSYFRDTDKWYLKLVDAERRLKKRGLIKSSSSYFVDRQWYSGVEDDHLPFLARGVPILHLIPSQFPRVWHTINDNRQIVDMTTTENMNKILRVFVAEYLHLVVEGEDSGDEDTQHYEL